MKINSTAITILPLKIHQGGKMMTILQELMQSMLSATCRLKDVKITLNKYVLFMYAFIYAGLRSTDNVNDSHF